MEQCRGYQSIINKLYAIYEGKGFLREEEALELMVAEDVSLVGINHITDRLLELGVVFTATSQNSANDADEDYTHTDYEPIYSEVLSISLGQTMLIGYIRRLRPPQRREWVNLIPQAKTGNQYALDRLSDMYLRVVVKLALAAYKTKGYEFDDLLQEGVMGLMRSIRKYNTSKHGSFVSYFPLWVMQYIGRALANKSRLIRIPVHAVENMINELYEYISLDDFADVDGNGYVEYNIANTANETIDDILTQVQLREVTNSALRSLSPREQEIVRMRYGLNETGKEYTLQEVGDIFQVTRERIRQIEEKALLKLRNPYRSNKLREFADFTSKN
jgi:RNA polymerase primary sigma factor